MGKCPDIPAVCPFHLKFHFFHPHKALRRVFPFLIGEGRADNPKPVNGVLTIRSAKQGGKQCVIEAKSVLVLHNAFVLSFWIARGAVYEIVYEPSNTFAVSGEPFFTGFTLFTFVDVFR